MVSLLIFNILQGVKKYFQNGNKCKKCAALVLYTIPLNCLFSCCPSTTHSLFTQSAGYWICLTVHFFSPCQPLREEKKINQETKCLKFHRNKAGYLMLTENPENKPFLILTQSFNETKTGFWHLPHFLHRENFLIFCL